jgi:hypothetical protein
VRSGAIAVTYRSASARRMGGDVVVRWAASAPRGTAFAVYREHDGVLVRAGAAGRADAFVDRGAPLGSRYWIRAQIGAAWSWRGPVAIR